jgi:hypothetical protein
MVAIVSDESHTIPKKTVLGVAEQIAEPLVNRINAESRSDTNSPLRPLRKRNNEVLYQKLLYGETGPFIPGKTRLNRAGNFQIRTCLS